MQKLYSELHAQSSVPDRSVPDIVSICRGFIAHVLEVDRIFVIMESGSFRINRPNKMLATYDYFVTGSRTPARVLILVTDVTQRL